MTKKHLFILFVFMLFSCKESNKEQISRLVKEWEGREIILPENIIFTRYGVDTLDYQVPEAEWKIITYIDSTGCTSCKLQFYRWKHIMQEVDSAAGMNIPFLFVFHPKRRDLAELNFLMKRDGFDHPVWIDNDDNFNKVNKFPADNTFHSLLVDKRNKVVALGNPFQNPKISELYMKIISDDIAHTSRSSTNTTVYLKESVVELGEFEWSVPQNATFTLKNNGDNRLVINDIVSSCGCIYLDYSRSAIEPGKDITINLTYKAEKPEYINKSFIIYANIKSPLKVAIKGKAH